MPHCVKDYAFSFIIKCASIEKFHAFSNKEKIPNVKKNLIKCQ
jgi:hypothetical protein